MVKGGYDVAREIRRCRLEIKITLVPLKPYDDVSKELVSTIFKYIIIALKLGGEIVPINQWYYKYKKIFMKCTRVSVVFRFANEANMEFFSQLIATRLID